MKICLKHIKGTLAQFREAQKINLEWLGNIKDKTEKLNHESQINKMNDLIDDYAKAVEILEQSEPYKT